MKENKLTPLMQQYLDLHMENPDAVLLFRLGDFYEAFFGDAKLISNAIGLALTHRGTDDRGCDIPMCGMPWHAADAYIGRLVKMGINVAIADQMETPEQAKERGHKQIDRKITRVITAGTLTDDNLLTPQKSNFLVAVIGNEFSGCDISTGEFFVGISDNFYDEMARLGPAEIIYLESESENLNILQIRGGFKTSAVFDKLLENPDILSVFNGYENDSVKLLAAYLLKTQKNTRLAFRTPYTYGMGNQLLVDSATWKSLEIDKPINEGGKCLLSVLDKTKTSAGARKLRAYLRNLSGDIGELRRRHEHIGIFITNRDLKLGFEEIMAGIPDVGRSLARLLSGRGFPRDLKAISDFLLVLPLCKSYGLKLDMFLAEKFKNLNTFDEFAGNLKFALNDNLPTFFRENNVIRTGYRGELDRIRDFSGGARDMVSQLQLEYSAKTGVSALKIKYNNMLGYHIEVPSKSADVLMIPENGFIHRQTMAGNMRFTTPELIDLDNEIRSSAERANAIENEIIDGLIDEIRKISEEINYFVDLLADVDVWLALANCALEYTWVMPKLSDDTEFDVRDGRHPVIEMVIKDAGGSFIKNDCYLDDKKIALLTGPNMAGKSTYLRQNAVIVVLAHLGSFVPAASAKIGICDQLFSRVGASDNLAAGQSTFMVEMQETANILNKATNKSFIIFDEIGRGTATFDGMAIARAVLEYINDFAPRTLFATHYHELTVNLPINVKNLTVQVQDYNSEVVFMHKIISGAAKASYGIHVARMAGMPFKLIDNAEKILAGLEQKSENAPAPTPDVKTVKSVLKTNPKILFVKNPESKRKNNQMSLFGGE